MLRQLFIYLLCSQYFIFWLPKDKFLNCPCLTIQVALLPSTSLFKYTYYNLDISSRIAFYFTSASTVEHRMGISHCSKRHVYDWGIVNIHHSKTKSENNVPEAGLYFLTIIVSAILYSRLFISLCCRNDRSTAIIN